MVPPHAGPHFRDIRRPLFTKDGYRWSTFYEDRIGYMLEQVRDIVAANPHRYNALSRTVSPLRVMVNNRTFATVGDFDEFREAEVDSLPLNDLERVRKWIMRIADVVEKDTLRTSPNARCNDDHCINRG
jgi:hypothetical protein